MLTIHPQHLPFVTNNCIPSLEGGEEAKTFANYCEKKYLCSYQKEAWLVIPPDENTFDILQLPLQVKYKTLTIRHKNDGD